MEIFILCSILVLLIFVSAFFSATETALTAFTRSKLHSIEQKNKKKYKLLKMWIIHPNKILSAILLGNNIVNILASSIATMLAISVLDNSPKAVGIATIIMTTLLLIFGEITPKVVAKAYSTKISIAVISFINLLSKIFSPITAILIFASKVIARIFGVTINEAAFLMTEEEIKSVVSAGEEEGVIETGEKKMIHSIFEFTDTTVKEVMVHRTSIFGVESSKSIDELWDIIIENSYSRIPVYDGKIDNIIGILYQKDLFKIVKKGDLSMTVGSCVRDAYFVPESKPLYEMLEEFKKKQIHIAVVIDEFGGTAGLVTIEDLLEEIVGEIRDEFDIDDVEDIKALQDEKFLINALLDVEYVNEELDLDIPVSQDYESVGGFVYASLGRVPLEKDRIVCENFEIRVLQVKNRRVDKVLILRRSPPDDDSSQQFI